MRQWTAFLCGFCVILAVLTGCQEDQRPSILVRINQQEIELEQFLKEFKAAMHDGEPIAPARRLQLQRAFMANLVDRVLLEQEARALGVEISQVEIDTALEASMREYPEGEFEEMLAEEGSNLDYWRQGLAHRLLVEKLTTRVTAAQIEVTDEDVRHYFEANREQYRRPYQVRARQLVVATKEEGEAALARIRGGEDFAAVAREVSLSPDAEEGGDLGYFARGELPPELNRAIFSLRKGRLSDVVKTTYGYHVFRVEGVRGARKLRLRDVDDDIREKLERQRAEDLYQQWLKQVRGRAQIEIDWSLLAQQQ